MHLSTQSASEAWRERTALGHAKVRAVSRGLVLAELERRGDNLLPGAAETLADWWAKMFDNARPEVIADYIDRHMGDEAVMRLTKQADDVLPI